MTNTPITELDFAAIKQQFKTYLKSQTRFKDYNFEGSNMSVLLDVLSYNSFLNNFYVNMAISEMFLDSAQLKNSVVSHAKELNYLPRSNISSKSVVRVTITDTVTTSSTIVIPQYTRFTTTYLGENYNFVTDKGYIAYKTSTGTFVADNVEIFEGEILTNFEKDGFLFSNFPGEDNSFRCVLTNNEVDINSVRVFSDDDTEEYVYRKDVYGVQSDDLVFYIEPYFDDKYVVSFGRNIYGKQPLIETDIKISYRICSGPEANGANRFSTTFRPNVVVTTIEAASGGAFREDLESIRYFAPRSIQIQERAVTSKDFETLLRRRFPRIQAISVYGGDELDPPQFGKVAISINLPSNQNISTPLKNDILTYLSDKTPIAIQPVFVDPQYFYALIDVEIFYSKKLTAKSTGQLEQSARATISTYARENLNEFGATLRNSRLTADIDDTETSFLNNLLKVSPYIEYRPILSFKENPTFNFGIPLIKPYPFQASQGISSYKPAIKSTLFNYDGVCCYFQDDGRGVIQIITDDPVNFEIVNASAGTVNYDTGVVRLTNFEVNAYAGTGIKIIANVLASEIQSPKNRVFIIRDEDVNITLIEKK